VVADAGIGLGKPGEPEFIQGLLDEWNVAHLLPRGCVDCLEDGHVTKMTSWALSRDPALRMFAISSKQDLVISLFFLGMSGPAYAAEVLAETQELEALHPGQFYSFVFAGERHTTVSVDTTVDLEEARNLPLEIDPALLIPLIGTFDGTQIGGVSVAEWLADGIEGVEGFTSLLDPEL
jgi:hypothetical protein